jgi:hypothetical protein
MQVGNPTADKGGIANEIVTLDRYGRLLSDAYLDDKGNPELNDRYATANFVYDQEGYLVEASFLDDKGQPARVSNGCSHLKITYTWGKLDNHPARRGRAAACADPRHRLRGSAQEPPQKSCIRRWREPSMKIPGPQGGASPVVALRRRRSN